METYSTLKERLKNLSAIYKLRPSSTLLKQIVEINSKLKKLDKIASEHKP